MPKQTLHDPLSPRLRTQLIRRAWVGCGIVAVCLADLAMFWLHISQASLKAQAFDTAWGTAQSLQKVIALDLLHLDRLLCDGEWRRQVQLTTVSSE